MNDFFLKCNMIIRSEIGFKKFGHIIKLPFYFHIKDISNDFYITEKENELEFYDKDIYFQNKIMKQESLFKSYLKYIDIKQFTIEDNLEENPMMDKYTLKKGNIRTFKNIDCLYEFLRDRLNFTEIDYNVMKLFIKNNQNKLINNFVDMVDKELEIGSKNDNPTEVFMILRCAYELNHTATVFPENKDKSISEYSFRELRIQRAYLGRKCELEKMEYDKIMKKDNK